MADESPKITPPCCDVWPQIAGLFQWYAYADWPDVLTMPCIGQSWRINYCPSCGKERRSTHESKAELFGDATPEADPEADDLEADRIASTREAEVDLSDRCRRE